MSPLTLDVGELRKRWMELYVNLMVIRSLNSAVELYLEVFKQRLAMMNEEFMTFFDTMETSMEDEAR